MHEHDPGTIRLYDDAAIYDLLNTPETAFEVQGLQRTARRWVRTGSRSQLWLEPACGTGRYLRVLAARKQRVLGFDRAPHLIEYAQQRLGPKLGRRARVFLADMTRFSTHIGRHTIDFAFNPHNTIRHLETDRAMLAHFRDMARVLRPGGLYAVGISLTRYGEEEPQEDLWTARRGRLGVRQLVQYLPPVSRRNRWEWVVSHLVVERGPKEEHRDDRYRLRCYNAAQWQRLIAASDLRRVASVDWQGKEIGDRAHPDTPLYGVELLGRKQDQPQRSPQRGRTTTLNS